MSDFLVAVNTIHFTTRDGDRKVVKARQPGKSHGLFAAKDLTDKAGRELLKADAIRPATTQEIEDAGGPAAILGLDDDEDLEDFETVEPVLAPKHKGGGKFVVINKEGVVVSPDGEVFANKDAALAWIEANPEVVAANTADADSLVG